MARRYCGGRHSAGSVARTACSALSSRRGWHDSGIFRILRLQDYSVALDLESESSIDTMKRKVQLSKPPAPLSVRRRVGSSQARVLRRSQFLHPVLQSEEEEGAALMSVCSWVTDLFKPRRAQAAFGVTLPIKAELASTQISNVHLVLYGDGEPGALKVICFENARRAIVEREVAAQKLAHDHENVLTLLRDEIVPTGARSTLHTHTMHACMHAYTLRAQ